MTAVPFRGVALSHQGRKRKTNQDWSGIADIEHPNGVYHLLVLADGMGGGVKGDVASELAVEAVVRYFHTARWYNPEDACREAAFSANRAVFDQGTGGGQATKSFMGTTLVFALVESMTGRLWMTNVGDSRGYLLRAEALQQVTRDHSVVADLGHEGPPLSPEEIARLRNVVTRAVGLEATVAPDVFGPMELEPGDRVVLSSDGLHGVVREDRIQRLAGASTMEGALKSLVAAANSAGGPDNITVVMGGREAAAAAGAGDRNLRTVVAAAGVAMVLVGVAALTVFVMRAGGSDNKGRAAATQTEEATATPSSTPAATPSPTAIAAPATMTAPGAIESGWTCSEEFDRLLRASQVVDAASGEVLAQPAGLKAEFYAAIDDAWRTSQPATTPVPSTRPSCDHAPHYVQGTFLSWPTCAWLARRPDLNKPTTDWACPR